jgi:stage II sporulation SpoE-like protein
MVWDLWGRPAGSGPLRRLLGDVGVAAALVALAGVLALGSLVFPGDLRPATVLAIPVLLGGLALPLWEMRVLIAASVVMIVLVMAVRGWTLPVGSGLVFVAVAAVSYEQSRRRERLGVRRARPDRILLDLRERLRVQGEVPPLPRGWGIEVELRPAYDAAMAGDFVASRVHAVDGHAILDLVLVDVSGKGVDAGTRALLLSGALGGLLGAVPPGEFLGEANRYLLQQRWTEGFATAVYLRVDLTTGDYRVENAGHPPAAHLDAGSGTWGLSPGRGPLLGVVPLVGHRPDTGVLRRGDAVLLYSDGVVEDRHRDIEVGVDRLLGAAERLVPRGDYRGGAAFLVREVATDTTDDRAVVMLWREY